MNEWIERRKTEEEDGSSRRKTSATMSPPHLTHFGPRQTARVSLCGTSPPYLHSAAVQILGWVRSFELIIWESASLHNVIIACRSPHSRGGIVFSSQTEITELMNSGNKWQPRELLVEGTKYRDRPFCATDLCPCAWRHCSWSRQNCWRWATSKEHYSEHSLLRRWWSPEI